MGTKQRLPELPEGYRLDLCPDPDVPALRRPDGTVVAHFSSRGVTREAIEREVLEDLLRATGRDQVRLQGAGPRTS
jgi:hypothetical protein